MVTCPATARSRTEFRDGVRGDRKLERRELVVGTAGERLVAIAESQKISMAGKPERVAIQVAGRPPRVGAIDLRPAHRPA